MRGSEDHPKKQQQAQKNQQLLQAAGRQSVQQPFVLVNRQFKWFEIKIVLGVLSPETRVECPYPF